MPLPASTANTAIEMREMQLEHTFTLKSTTSSTTRNGSGLIPVSIDVTIAAGIAVPKHLLPLFKVWKVK